MDHVPAELFPQSDQDKFLDVAHKDRWEYLKQVIVDLYLGGYGKGGKSTTINQVAEFMRTHYSFHASPTEYPRQFRAWNISKRVVKDMMDDVTYALAKRKRPGTSTSQVTVLQEGHETPLNPSKLMRHLKEARRRQSVQAITPGLLSSWNLPYEAFVSSIHKGLDKPSPFGPLGTTPDYLKIQSPEALTPGREAAGPSPNLQLVYQKAREHRATLFLQGRLEDLVVSMCREDRRLLVNYFHDFYIHGLTMAKNWGLKPPTRPTAFPPASTSQAMDTTESPETPSFFLNLPSSPSVFGSPGRTDISSAPTQLCRWTIHVAGPRGDARCIDLVQERQGEDNASSFTNELHQSMLSDTFTRTPVDDLPLARDTIVHAIEDDPAALQLDAWKLAIMAGNTELLKDLTGEDFNDIPEGIDNIYPLHLAASFLDGGHSCCMVFTLLSFLLSPTYAFHHNVDNHGHTILDALMASVLRSHTSLEPDIVSYGFHSPSRFPGEEKDICGRWDAETPKVRDLFSHGFSRIPTRWKHPFCHTSVQAVCHSIIVIFTPACAPNINSLSGLFIRRCIECGMELRLGPLHTLVVTAFYLAQIGMPGETLFGALAVLVCLLSLGADASLKVNISVEEILRISESGKCHHTQLSPLELMREVPDNLVAGWSDDCQKGWNCLSQILTRAEMGKHQSYGSYTDSDSESVYEHESICEVDERGYHDARLKLKCQDTKIGLLWATIQAELLTYRRVGEKDVWLSENFSMEALENWLLGDSPDFLTPLVQNQMLRRHSPCGWFYKADEFVCPTAQEVSTEYFMNMDIYERSTFIESPKLTTRYGLFM
ncbi:hypothetical protein F5Y19DRAFT_434960, partial [Xylariaceae sp. FL1651]